MSKPMKDVQVLEVIAYAFAPADGAILAEWGQRS